MNCEIVIFNDFFFVQTTAEQTEATVRPATECSEGNPCGWAVYGTSKIKKTQYFIRNT